MPNRDQMWGPMSLEEYADKIGEDLSQRPVPLTGLEELPDVGSLHHARVGDSISSILGTSDPAAIGAFMEANGLKNSGLRAGQSYLVPRRADLADQSMAGRGQAALTADNARAQERARSTILPGDVVTVLPGMAVFDPQKGILATQRQFGASGSWAGERYRRGAAGAEIAGHFVDGFDTQNGDLGLLDNGRAAAKIGKFTKPLGLGLSLVEDGLNGVAEYKGGAPGADVAVGALSKTAIKSIASGAGGIIGTFTGPAAPFLVPAFAWAGGEIADRALDGTSSAALGRKVKGQMEELGRNPYGYGAF